MGPEISKSSSKIPLDKKFRYRVTDFEYEIGLTYGDIKGEKNFIPLPKKNSAEYKQMLSEWN